jgi:hypothetical protein
VSLGPVLHFNGISARGGADGKLHLTNEEIPMPYRIIGGLPLISVSRTPVRFSIGFIIFSCILYGYGMKKLTSVVNRKKIVLAVAASLIIFEYAAAPFIVADMRVDPAIQSLAEAEGEVVYDIPSGQKPDYLQTIHRKKRIAGSMARVPIETSHYWQQIDEDSKQLSAIQFVEKYDLDHVIVHMSLIPNAQNFSKNLEKAFGEAEYVSEKYSIYSVA